MQTQLPAIIPTPRCSLTIREARADDLPFLDGLQKLHYHMVGWFPRKQMEGYVAMNAVLIAEGRDDEARPSGSATPARRVGESSSAGKRAAPVALPYGRASSSTPLGYVIWRDSYNGRDDVGIIYQLNIAPLRQRHLIGASLVKAAFERAAYGCKLFCCWCAQDIQANYFWESIGFVPLAFRTGSRGRQRTHIFWQRRIRENDVSTAWWYPSQTRSGAIREDRLVFPIPPDVDWRDAKPVVLPQVRDASATPLPPGEVAAQRSGADGEGRLQGNDRPLALGRGDRGTSPGGRGVERPQISPARKVAIVRSSSKVLQGLPPGKAAVITGGGIRYIDRADYVPEPAPEKKPRKPRAPAAKHDAKHLAFARDLRDRYLEQINSDPGALLPAGKYEVSRQLPASAEARVEIVREPRQLPAAA